MLAPIGPCLPCVAAGALAMRPRPLLALGLLLGLAGPPARGAERPNVVLILADDLGYGDVSCYNPAGKIATPHLDRLAAQGMRFTDAHTGSSVCTPTRYGLLTGRYSWRSTMQSGVLGGYSRRLIEPDRLTLAGFLKRQGYDTAAVGKWHLGMDWPLKGGGVATDYPDGPNVDYAARVPNGPLAVGFDHYFGISASLDMPPYIFIRDDRPVGLATAEKTWIRTGPAAPDFEAIDVLPALTKDAIARLDAWKSGDRPFFLYLPLASPHTPIVPTAEWAGKSGLTPYGDFAMQTDAAIGAVLAALDRNGQAANTLVVVTSDNGCAPMAGFDEMVKLGHHPSGPFRGHKADIFEGGHRVPFVVRWPGKVAAGAVSDALVGLSDVFATVADALGVSVPPDAAEDSMSVLPVLQGRSDGPRRESIVHLSAPGAFAIRKGNWKLCLCPGSGGWSEPRPGSPAERGLPKVQLYDLAADPGERTNLQAEHPEIVAELTALLEDHVARGRSTPGPDRPNDGTIDIHRGQKAPPAPAAKKAAARKAQQKAKAKADARPD
jgi:arylsulfatase A-like enzyme